jgi:hypothetical protein
VPENRPLVNPLNFYLASARHQQAGAGIAVIDQMFRRQQLLGRQSGLDARRHRVIGQRARCRDHMRDHVRSVIITSFGQMGLVTDPSQLALGAVASVYIVGRVDQLAGGRRVILAPPAYRLFRLWRVVLLPPDASQDMHLWQCQISDGNVPVVLRLRN